MWTGQFFSSPALFFSASLLHNVSEDSLILLYSVKYPYQINLYLSLLYIFLHVLLWHVNRIDSREILEAFYQSLYHQMLANSVSSLQCTSIKSHLDVQADYVCCFTPVNSHCHFLKQVNSIWQAWLPLYKCPGCLWTACTCPNVLPFCP